MKALMLYQPQSEHGRKAEEYARDFKKVTAKSLELLDWDSIEGSTFASSRDIVIAPSIVIIDDKGSVLHQWLGDQFPLFNDVSAYMTSP